MAGPRRRLILWLAAAVAVVAALGSGVWLYERGEVRAAYPDPARYPVRGIDDLHRLLTDARIGLPCNVELLRQSRKTNLSVTTHEAPS